MSKYNTVYKISVESEKFYVILAKNKAEAKKKARERFKKSPGRLKVEIIQEHRGY